MGCVGHREVDPGTDYVKFVQAEIAKLKSDSPIKDKWALVIGISKFANPQYNLKYAAKDARDFYNYLITDAHFQKDHVLLLLDEQATKINILNAFGDKWLPNLCQEGDLAVVYVSTHGTLAEKDRGSQNYIVTYDTDATSLFATGVNMDELYGQIKERIKTDRALIVMDTCYSGGGVPGSKGLGDAANFSASDIAQGCGHLVITSSSPSERSWESKSRPNGIFTSHLLDALRAYGGKVDVKSAFERTKQDVQWDVKASFGESQTPQLGGEWEG